MSVFDILSFKQCFNLGFQDPSVQNAVSASQNQQQNLDDYNPFANQQAQTGVAGNGPFPAGSQLGGPAPVLSTQNIDQGAPPPSYTATNQQQISSKDFEVKQIADKISTNFSKFLFMIFFIYCKGTYINDVRFLGGLGGQAKSDKIDKGDG